MLSVPVAASEPEVEAILVHPPFASTYGCTEHWYGQLPHLGDALGSDCTVGRLVEEQGRSWVREYENQGLENEDWFGWGEDVLAPCDCEVVEIRINPESNQPGILGKPPASSITFRREDDVHILYAHISSPSVTEGDLVVAGDVVAKVGNNGYSRQPHVHIGAWRGETALQLRFDQTRMNGRRSE